MTALAILLVFLAGVLAWNFIPAVRERVKGWTTILEVIGAGALQLFDVFGQALQEVNKLGYLPPQLASALPFIILAWVMYKRLATTTPVGKK